jgi:hypothetical protein
VECQPALVPSARLKDAARVAFEGAIPNSGVPNAGRVVEERRVASGGVVTRGVVMERLIPGGGEARTEVEHHAAAGRQGDLAGARREQAGDGIAGETQAGGTGRPAVQHSGASRTLRTGGTRRSGITLGSLRAGGAGRHRLRLYGDRVVRRHPPAIHADPPGREGPGHAYTLKKLRPRHDQRVGVGREASRERPCDLRPGRVDHHVRQTLARDREDQTAWGKAGAGQAHRRVVRHHSPVTVNVWAPATMGCASSMPTIKRNPYRRGSRVSIAVLILSCQQSGSFPRTCLLASPPLPHSRNKARFERPHYPDVQ